MDVARNQTRSLSVTATWLLIVALLPGCGRTGDHAVQDSLVAPRGVDSPQAAFDHSQIQSKQTTGMPSKAFPSVTGKLVDPYGSVRQLEDTMRRVLTDSSPHSRRDLEYPRDRDIIVVLITELEAANRIAQADLLRQGWLDSVKRQTGHRSEAYANELADYGLHLLHSARWIDAETVLHECLDIRLAEQAESWTTFYTQSMLGGALFGQEKYDEAEPLLLAGYDGMKQLVEAIPPHDRSRLIEARDRLMELYVVLDDAVLDDAQPVGNWQSEPAPPEAQIKW